MMLVAVGSSLAAPIPAGEKDTYEPYWTACPSTVRATYAEVEPNDSFATAQPAACGDVIDPAQINVAGDYDYYSFYATAGTPLTVGTDQVTGQATMDTYIYLYDPSQTLLESDDDDGPGSFSLITEHIAPVDGTYYLAVKCYYSTQTGYYKAFISCTPPPTGACCQAQGVCVELTASACATASGTYMGDNTVCDPSPCPQPPPNDTCAGAIPLTCSGTINGTMAAASGDYTPGVYPSSCTGYAATGPDVTYVVNLKAGDLLHLSYTTPSFDGSIYVITDCASPSTTCGPGRGADDAVSGGTEVIDWTCDADGIYYIIVDAYTSATSGTWTLDYSIPCLGACCAADGSCTVTTETGCVTPSIWHGEWADCSVAQCPQPVTGACCDRATGNCAITTQAGCAYEWLGEGVVCDVQTCPVPPPTGACCNQATGDCAITTLADCAFAWLGENVPCDVVTCPPPPATGACCDQATGHCVITTLADCQFAWLGEGVVCDALTCPPPPPLGACCDQPTGDCTMTTEADCHFAWLGANILCDVQVCPPPPVNGACCNTATGVCTITTQAACQYSWLGAGSVCNATVCPPPVPVEQKTWGQIKSNYR